MTKTTYSRADRVADQIRMEVADILMRKIKDPRVRSVTVTDVELTKDLRIARIFVTTMEQNKMSGMCLMDWRRPAALFGPSWGGGWRCAICRN